MSLCSVLFSRPSALVRAFARAKPKVNWEADNFYERLGVKQTASADEIKKRYHEIVRAYHPDACKGDEEKANGEKIMAAVNAAYDTLKDEKKRREYDSVQAGGFGGFRGFNRPQQRAPQVFREAVNLTFTESVFGCARILNLATTEPCKTCGGNGTADGKPPPVCVHCGGAGFIAQGFFPMPCPACGGAGFTIDRPCRACRGTAEIPKPTQLTVNIPPGVDNGSVINFATPFGHVIVMCRVREDPLFLREGDDLHVTVPISMKTAALGGTAKIPTLNGIVEKRVRPGTQPYDVERMTGAGIGGRGSLFIHYKVLIPRSTSRADRKAIEKLDDKYMKSTLDMWNSNLKAFEARVPKRK